MKPSLPCSILRQLMMALFLLSCLSGVRRSLYHALRLQFPQVSCQSLLVAVWSCVPGWLHLCGPVLVLQLRASAGEFFMQNSAKIRQNPL